MGALKNIKIRQNKHKEVDDDAIYINIELLL